eukprot:1653458-Amphidinium_carterae.3
MELLELSILVESWAFTLPMERSAHMTFTGGGLCLIPRMRQVHLHFCKTLWGKCGRVGVWLPWHQRCTERGWYLYLAEALEATGWQQHPLEGSLWLFYECGDGLSQTCVMRILITHVDDLLTAGTGEEYQKALTNLQQRMQLKFTKPPLVYCGMGVLQSSEGILIHQAKATLALEEVVLSIQWRA